MTIMTNVAGEVKKFLDNSPCIRRNMDIKLINTRGLSKMIIEEKKLDTTLDSVASAIRRYRLNSHNPIFDTARKIISETLSISTKNRLVRILLRYETEIQNLLLQLYSIIDNTHEDVLRIAQLDKNIKIIVDEKNLEIIQKILPKKYIEKIDRNIAEIKLIGHLDSENTPGFVALITTDLSINEINILGIVTYPTVLVFYIKEDDLVKTHNVIHRLCQL